MGNSEAKHTNILELLEDAKNMGNYEVWQKQQLQRYYLVQDHIVPVNHIEPIIQKHNCGWSIHVTASCNKDPYTTETNALYNHGWSIQVLTLYPLAPIGYRRKTTLKAL